ncbi:MAG: hypothetical protein HY928_06760 [Elusimicrobia bacterium]|nr:hypothetical protein [Elusimicrobiota bacterium]
MNAPTMDLVDLVVDRAKDLGPRDRRELAEAIAQRLGVTVAVGVAGTSQQAAGTSTSRWAGRAQELRAHPMRQSPLPDADWDAFKGDMGTVRGAQEDIPGR